MRILVVDDEAPARQRLAVLIEELGPPYRVVGEAADGAAAVALWRSSNADLLLMDIRMPGVDGLQAAAELAREESPPAVVFITAYDEHALAAFEQQAVDYLLKPVRRSRLQQALERAQRLTRAQLSALRPPAGTQRTDYVSASYRGGLVRIPLDEVIYFQADQKYVTLRHLQGEALLEQSLKSLEEQFGDRFLRIHRNALVAIDRLRGIRKLADGRVVVELRDCAQQLEVSRRHLPQVRRLLRGRL